MIEEVDGCVATAPSIEVELSNQISRLRRTTAAWRDLAFLGDRSEKVDS